MKKLFLSFILVFSIGAKGFAGDYFEVGIDCFKKGFYDKSTISLEKAVRINPKNVNARYYLAQSYLMQKRVKDATKQYDSIILIAPSSEAARLSQKGLSLIQQASAKTAAPTAPIASSGEDLQKYKDNYLNYVLTSDNSIVRWQAFPINVYIQPKRQKTLVKGAFEQWQEKSGNLVSFNFVNSPKEAQLTVDFQQKLENSSTKDSYIAGFSKPYYQNDNIVGSEIHLLAVDPQTGKDIEDDFVYFSALHEIGHSLGFKGHSPDEKDVMAGSASVAKPNLTKRDINTLMVFYKSDKKAPNVNSNPQTDVKLQQALDYVKQFPDKATGWANLGDLYRNKKMYSDAIKNYQKAISIEPQKAEFYNLVGVTYTSMGDSRNAFNNLKKACDLDGTNPYYLYLFAQSSIASNQRAVGKAYVNSYLQKNPEAAKDEKIQSILKQL